MELRFINKTGNRHFDKPSYVLTGILQARWVRMPWLKNTPMAHAAQFLLVYALVYMRGKPQLECLPFMVCTLDKWEHKLYTNALTFSVEHSDSLAMPLGEAVDSFYTPQVLFVSCSPFFPNVVMIYICCSFYRHSIRCFSQL